MKTAAKSGETVGRGEEDYYLIKTDPFGVEQWHRSFGSKKADIGVSVLQAEDGGFVILGKTFLANVWTIAFIKTNSEGKLE